MGGGVDGGDEVVIERATVGTIVWKLQELGSGVERVGTGVTRSGICTTVGAVAAMRPA